MELSIWFGVLMVSSAFWCIGMLTGKKWLTIVGGLLIVLCVSLLFI